MSLLKWTFAAVLLLPAAEFVTFVLVALAIGWLAASALILATSLMGMRLLRRSGRSHLARLRAALLRDGVAALHLDTPGAATMIAGILLVIPGFITDAAAAVLLVAPLRRWLGQKLTGKMRGRRNDNILDLEPGEWRQIPERPQRRRGKAEKA
ncbi:MAG: FxsA family protein [Xanthobacteraceae bacterium]